MNLFIVLFILMVVIALGSLFGVSWYLERFEKKIMEDNDTIRHDDKLY